MKRGLLRRIIAMILVISTIIVPLNIPVNAFYAPFAADPVGISINSQTRENPRIRAIWDDGKTYNKPYTYSDLGTDAQSGVTTATEYGLGEALSFYYNKLLDAEKATRKTLLDKYKTAKTQAIKTANAANEKIKSMYKNVKSYFGGNTNKPNFSKAQKNTLNNLKGQTDWARDTKVSNARNSVNASRAKTNSLKGTKARCAGMLNAIFSWYNLRQTFKEPEFGFESPFYELCATELRFFANTLIFLFPPSAPYFAVADLVFTSKLFVWLTNKFAPRIQYLDDFALWLKKIALSIEWMGKWADRFFLDVVEEGQLNEMRQIIRETEWKQQIMQKKVDEFIKEIGKDKSVGATCTANDIHVYKPNIYLYPEKTENVTVTFNHPTALTVTDPIYPNNGWNVIAHPDGAFNAENGEYSFLFYEASTSESYYQTNSGFVIPADCRAEIFTEILKGYGLNEREIKDFNEFWCEKLELYCDYAMYPQLTETIDAAMPVNISPAPDSVLRIWFAFVKNDIPSEEAVPSEFVRDGFTVVEWGGFFIGE